MSGRNGHHEAIDVGEVVDLTKLPAPPKTTPETTSGRPAETTGETAGESAGPGGERLMPPPPRLPGWLRDPRAHGQWWARYLYRIVGAWALQSGSAGWKATGRSLYRGPARAAQQAHRWATDPASKVLLDDLARRNATGDWLRVADQRHKTIGAHRPYVALAAGLGVVMLAVGGLVYGTWSMRVLVSVVWVVVFGAWYGRDPAEPLFTPVVLKDPRYRKLEPDHLHRAFIAAGLASEPGKPGKPGPIDIVVNPHREGPGAQVATVDLPHGRTVADAIKARDRIASGGRWQSSCLFLSADRFSADTHDGRLIVRLTRTDPMAADPVVSPLVGMDSTDVFDAVPVGVDERGDLVTVAPLWRSILVSGQARTGKSFSARLLALAMVLDPAVRVGAVFDAKASADHRELARLAYASGFGDDDDVRRLLAATLRAFCDEIIERNQSIAKLPISQRREGKLTKRLAQRYPVTLVLLEEIQDLFSGGVRSDKLGREIEALVTRIVKKGPSVGFVTIISTQRPDKDSVPPALRDQFQLRIGLRNVGDAVQVMALGSSAADLGFDVRTLPAGDRYRGAAYLVGEGLPERYIEGGCFTKFHFADETHAHEIIERALQARIDRELLCGMAAGDEVDTGAVTLLDDIAAVFEPGEDWLWSHIIIDRLTDAFPGRYHYDAQSFGNAVKGIGLATEPLDKRVERKPVRNAGLRWAHVAAAVAARTDALDDPDGPG